MTKNWIKERQGEYYYRLAKETGYRSRAAYKLLQISKKYGLIREGDTVVDLGAAPGGWLQAARTIVSARGFILGVDIEPIKALQWSNIESLVGDIRELEGSEVVKKLPKGKADVVLSDVAPNISGVWEVDHAKQIELAKASFRIASAILRPGGNFLVKVFQGDLLNGFVAEVEQSFRVVKIVKPKASRAKSSELYVVGLRLCSH